MGCLLESVVAHRVILKYFYKTVKFQMRFPSWEGTRLLSEGTVLTTVAVGHEEQVQSYWTHLQRNWTLRVK